MGAVDGVQGAAAGCGGVCRWGAPRCACCALAAVTAAAGCGASGGTATRWCRCCCCCVVALAPLLPLLALLCCLCRPFFLRLLAKKKHAAGAGPDTARLRARHGERHTRTVDRRARAAADSAICTADPHAHAPRRAGEQVPRCGLLLLLAQQLLVQHHDGVQPASDRRVLRVAIGTMPTLRARPHGLRQHAKALREGRLHRQRALRTVTPLLPVWWGEERPGAGGKARS